MKTGPNAPCPCGSGRKYKKCCGQPSAPSPDPRQLTLFDDGPAPDRYVPADEAKDLLNPQQAAFVTHLLQLAKQEKAAAYREILRLLERVPAPACWLVEPLVTLRLGALAALRRHREYAWSILEHLVNAGDEQRWVERGAPVLHWVHGLKEPAEAEPFVSRLRQCCATHSFAVPRLILATTLRPSNPPSQEVLTLYREALMPERWQPYLESISPWLDALAIGFFCLIATATQAADAQGVAELAAMARQFPWDDRLRRDPFELLCVAMSDAELDQELQHLCQRHLEKHPDWISARYWLGHLAARAGDHEQAAEHMASYLTTQDIADHRLVRAGLVLLEAGRHAQARRALEAVKDRNGTEYLILEVGCLRVEGQLQQALSKCDQLLARQPGDEASRMLRAHLVAELNRAAESAG